MSSSSTMPGPVPTLGDRFPARELSLTRLDVIRYCGASGDFNSIHWSDRAARDAGLPGAIAHGMLTLGIVGRAVTDWCGAPWVRSYRARFARPLPVPDEVDGVTLTVSATVTAVSPNGEITLGVEVTSGGSEILSRAEAVVSWPTLGESV